VYLGAASVVTPVRDVRVHAGQQVFVDCHERPCRISGPFLFQPGESFALVPEHPKPLAHTIRGADAIVYCQAVDAPLGELEAVRRDLAIQENFGSFAHSAAADRRGVYGDPEPRLRLTV
jgi:hypothetical protein